MRFYTSNRTSSLLLASRSPRRLRMLRWLGIGFARAAADIDESPRPGEPPRDLAARLAHAKAAACRSDAPHARILAADTVVDLDGRSLGKPADAADARRMLEQLRAAVHQVHTGVALALDDGSVHTRRVTTDVQMRPYTDAEIDAYIATGDPMDKAGAYAIQHAGFDPVERVDVCYANVVGLPFCAVVRLFHDYGWPLAVDVPQLCYLHFGYRCPGPDAGVGVAL